MTKDAAMEHVMLQLPPPLVPSIHLQPAQPIEK